MPRFLDKLVEAKRRWSRSRRLVGLSRRAAALPDSSGTARLPPGQKRVDGWPVLDLGYRPVLTPGQWRLKVDGLVKTPVELSWRELLALGVTRKVSDVHCVTSWSRFDNHWEGVEAATLAARVTPLPEAAWVLLESYDNYTTNMKLKDFLDDGVILAIAWEGAPLPPEHGGPVRLIVPKLYLWKSPKWLKRVTFSASDKRGFWEERGYHNDADPWREQRYSWQEEEGGREKKTDPPPS